MLLVPYYLFVTHLASAFLFAVVHPIDVAMLSPANPLLALGGAMAVDVAMMIAVRAKRRWWDPSPHIFVRTLAAYLATTGGFTLLYGQMCMSAEGTNASAMVALGVFGTLAAMSVASFLNPILAFISAVLATLAAVVFASSPLVLIGAPLFAWSTFTYSLVLSRGILEFGRRRANVESLARKSKSFVEEFETSGRGWFWETDTAGTLSYVSQQLADDFDCAPADLLGRSFTDLLSVENAKNQNCEERKTLGFHLSARFPFSEVIVRPASEKDVNWSLSGNPIFDDRGRFLGFRGIGTDLTEQLRSEQEINRLARFDSLTGLPNRAMMRQTLDEALRNATYRRKGCALFLIDLDRFKQVNDTLGHPVGDALLRQVAERLRSVMGNHGKVGRLGGDEFQAVLPGTSDIGLLEALARTLIEQISRPYTVEGNQVRIGASVGIEIGDPGNTSADAVVRNADLALYAAKAAGRGKHMIFAPAMHSEAAERQLLENDLRQAIERDELVMLYQPIVHSAGEDISGFEALIRWRHPTRGLVSPERFIPLAEETGLITQIGEWALTRALEDAATWPDSVRVAVNLSSIQFNDPACVETISRLLMETGVAAQRLELELTESVFMADSDTMEDTFARLKQLGVRLALDDFGTGYSSLGYLKKAPFDKIKIDQSFVRGAASRDVHNAAIIRAIVTLAELLGMDTCAEGVETHDDLQLVRELGVSMVQGYIFGKPDAAEIAAELTRNQTVVPDGFDFVREPRHRLMRRAMTAMRGEMVEVRLSNISSMGAMVECAHSVTPGDEMVMDIIGVGPVRGMVRWAQAGKFGIKFDEEFNLARLAPKRDTTTRDIAEQRPWYLKQQEAVG